MNNHELSWNIISYTCINSILVPSARFQFRWMWFSWLYHSQCWKSWIQRTNPNSMYWISNWSFRSQYGWSQSNRKWKNTFFPIAINCPYLCPRQAEKWRRTYCCCLVTNTGISSTGTSRDHQQHLTWSTTPHVILFLTMIHRFMKFQKTFSKRHACMRHAYLEGHQKGHKSVIWNEEAKS